MSQHVYDATMIGAAPGARAARPGGWRLRILTDPTLDAHSAARAATLPPEAIIVPTHQEGCAHFSSPPGALVAAFSGAGRSDRLHLPLPGDDVAIVPRQS